MARLAGLRIVVTRAAHQAEELAAPLRSLGADVILLPMIGIVPPPDIEPLRAAASRVPEYEWILFTSANAVRALAAEIPSTIEKQHLQIAAIGNGTQRAAEKCGFRVTLTASDSISEGLVEAFKTHARNRSRVLIPSAAVTRDAIAPELRRLGFDVEVVEAYRNAIPPEAAAAAREVLRPPYPEWITFASPSAVHNLAATVPSHAIQQSRLATIGPVTSAAVVELGLRVSAEADPHDVGGLVKAILKGQEERSA